MEFTDALNLLIALAEPTNILSVLGVFSVFAKMLDFDKADKAVKKLEDDPTVVKKFLKQTVNIVNLIGLAKKVKK
mgnify:CR=1 FL=1